MIARVGADLNSITSHTITSCSKSSGFCVVFRSPIEPSLWTLNLVAKYWYKTRNGSPQVVCDEPFKFGSRENRTAIELFVAGIAGWEAGLQRRIEDGNNKHD